MHAIVNTAPGKLEWLSLPTPDPAAGQVRVRTAAVGICATDLEMIRGWARTAFPATPGHEWAGHIDAIGPGVDPALLGRACVAENVLADGGEVGFEHPGAYGQFFLTDAANVRTLPDDFPLAHAALIEPLAVVLRGQKRLSMGTAIAAPVLIIGDGPIGLLNTMVLRHRGIGPLTLLGGRPSRLAAAARLGAEVTIDHTTLGPDIASVVSNSPVASPGATGGLSASAIAPASSESQSAERTRALLDRCGGPFTTVIEASGSPEGIRTAMSVAARGGLVLVLGDYAHAQADFSWKQLVVQEFTVIGSNASAGAWDDAVELATAGLPLGSLISHRFPAESYSDATDLLRSGEDGVIKVVLEW